MTDSTPHFTWDHVHLRSPDVPATASWLQDKLAAATVTGTSVTADRAELILAGVKVLVTSIPTNETVHPAPATPHQGLDHFGLAVRDLDKVADQLKAKGVVFTRGPLTPRPGIRIAFIRGPQGISIELLERDAKYT
ncbi:glyoxalase [Afipia sp. P52-10]|uniref:VOC family protein n=1 Tax=Afipia sp. P52-10 TaxID=1429916 RepID=UPI0003DF244E|nr:VOC family protein [Afipia sp. P52-10]ETR78821.1 glyoxalase [Afipia sp. P52-10]